MTDVDHELNAIRFVVDSPLSSKVAKFNAQNLEHRNNQLLNPFSEHTGRPRSPKLSLSAEEYGKPKKGSMTEYRGMKANIQVYQEMIELCHVIYSEGRPRSKKEPDVYEITFGELFQIYTHINDKVVGLLLRARKHGLLNFEGECLFQKFSDHVEVYLMKPFKEIKEIMSAKQAEIKRDLSPNPRPTNEL